METCYTFIISFLAQVHMVMGICTSDFVSIVVMLVTAVAWIG